jgi:hypothetical protein
MDALLVAGLGFALGLRHAADADHVVAVTAIAARHRRVGPAALVGALWGLGHTLTLCLAGGLIIALNLFVPPRVGLALEFAVGIASRGGPLNGGQGGFGAPARGLPAGVPSPGVVHGQPEAQPWPARAATVREPWAAFATWGVWPQPSRHGV